MTGDSLCWILFDFPSTVSLMPGDQYNLRVEYAGGYGLDKTRVGVAVGGLGSNAYSAGATWRANFGEPVVSDSDASTNATVPEPTMLVMLIVAAAGVSTRCLSTLRMSKLINA